MDQTFIATPAADIFEADQSTLLEAHLFTDQNGNEHIEIDQQDVEDAGITIPPELLILIVATILFPEAPLIGFTIGLLIDAVLIALPEPAPLDTIVFIPVSDNATVDYRLSVAPISIDLSTNLQHGGYAEGDA